jgi:gluconokinase
MKLVTFNEGRVGRIRDGKTIEELDVPTMREYFEGGESAKPTGKTFLLDDVRLRAPIVPKKFFHTAGNYQEHHEESLRVGWSHPVRPWIVFFQNVDAIIGTGEDIVYPEHLTNELDYELELAVIIKKAGKFFTAEEAHEYIGGFIVFNDITARDIQRREMRSGVFSFCKAIDTFVPIGPWIVTPDEIPDPHNLNVELRVNGEKRQISNTSHMSYSIEEIIAHYSVYRAAMRVLARVVADVRLRGDDVAAIGFSSAMHGVLCVNEAGEPLSHVLTWMDRRSTEIADGWRADGTAATLYRETGAPMHPMLPIAKLPWLAEHEPDLFRRTHRFVGLKELFVHRWTGEWLIDWGIAGATGMFAFASRTWSERALALAGVDATRLSTLAAPSTSRTTIRAPIAHELGVGKDTAVVLASSDGALANIGIGTGAGDVAVTLGTSGAVRTLSTEPVLDGECRTFCYPAGDTTFVIGGPTSSAGASLDWIFALLLDELPKEQRFARAAELAAQIPPGADGCTVLPFLSGERAPYWNASLRGSFAGLDLAHDRRAILRASFEAVVFGVFEVYEVLLERLGTAQRLLLSGGLTKSSLVRQMLANVFAVETAQPHQEEASAFGAALVAAQSRGLIADAISAARAAGYDDPMQPDLTQAAAYRTARARYRLLVDRELKGP